MCKIMVMAGINNSNRKLALEFTKLMAKQLTPGNSDGLGYAAVTAKGKLFGERWLNNADAFVNRPIVSGLSKQDQDIVNKFQGFLVPDIDPVTYNSFGTVEENHMVAVTLHTRLATSGKEFINTHPFVVGQTSLIHNGVISNATDLKMTQSTCDSESILNEYVDNKVNDIPQNIKKVAGKLRGYFACGVFSKTNKPGIGGTNGMILDIFKCSRANLEAAYVVDLNTVVFSSRLSDIQLVCKQMGMEIGKSFKVNDDMMVRLDPVTGQVITTEAFDSFGFERPTSYSSFTKSQRREIRKRLTELEKTSQLSSDDGPSNPIEYYDVYNGPISDWGG